MSDTPPPAGPKPAPQPAFFDNPAIDNLIAVTLALGAELWSQRDRMRALEKLLAARGIVSDELLEQYQPTDAELAASKAAREEFVNRIYGAFARPTVPGTPERDTP
jgi:hypothetical protein